MHGAEMLNIGCPSEGIGPLPFPRSGEDAVVPNAATTISRGKVAQEPIYRGLPVVPGITRVQSSQKAREMRIL